jgi:iron complex outermembrane receptor protein
MLLTRRPRRGGAYRLRSRFSHLIGPFCLICSMCASTVGHAQSAPALPANIAAQALPDALDAFANQTGLQLIYLSDLAKDRRSKGARAGVPVAEALSQLLSGTGLRFQFLNPRTVRVFADPAALGNGGHSPPKVRPPEVHSAVEDTSALREILVTASQREERLDQSPISAAVWSQSRLETAGIKDMPALAALTPGVELDAYTDLGPGIETNIAIRGINSKDGSTTAIYLDDVPLPTDRSSIFGRAFPATFDLERVEVLRGPQGSSAGDGAEGGVVRFITQRPNLADFDGFARAEFALTKGGAPSYETSAAAGGPLVRGKLGFRLAASVELPGGFVDRVDPFTGAVVEANANRARRETVHAALAFTPIESLRIAPSFYYHSDLLHDTPAFYTYLSDPDSGVLRNGKLLRQWSGERFYVASVALEATLPNVTAVLTSAYMDRWANALDDQTNLRGFFWPNPMGPEYPVSYTDAQSEILTLGQFDVFEELRLSSRDAKSRVQWIAGFSLLDGHANESQPSVGVALSEGGNVGFQDTAVRSTEHQSVFGQFVYRITDRLAATVALRAERAYFNSSENLGSGGSSNGIYHSTDSRVSTAPGFNVSYQTDEADLLYANIAQGYRTGGPNAQFGGACPAPATYGPDSVWSVEVGAKNNFFQQHLRIDTSVYRAEWRDQQTEITLPACGFGYTSNAGAAVSQGMDMGIEALFTEHLQAFLSVAYVDAHYSQTVWSNGAIIVARGDAIGALPLVSAPWTATAAVDYRVPVPSPISLVLHAQDVFHSKNPGPFASQNPEAVIYDPTRRPNPSTNQLDIRTTVTWSSLEAAVFLYNVFDAQPILQRRNWSATDTLYYATTFRPRTVGLAMTWHF